MVKVFLKYFGADVKIIHENYFIYAKIINLIDLNYSIHRKYFYVDIRNTPVIVHNFKSTNIKIIEGIAQLKERLGLIDGRW